MAPPLCGRKHLPVVFICVKMSHNPVLLLSFLTSLLCIAYGAEVSKWNIDIFTLKDAIFRKTLYANTTISIKFNGDKAACEEKKMTFKVSWYLRSSICYNEVFNTRDSAALTMFGLVQRLHQDWAGFYSFGHIYFENCSSLLTPKVYYTEFPSFSPLGDLNDDKATNQTRSILGTKLEMSEVAKSWSDSPYMFIVKFRPETHLDTSKGQTETEDKDASSNSEEKFSLTMTVEMKGPHDYSSPADWPLMKFFMAMCIVYVLFGALWFFWLVCYWRDLLRIQFWIGAVIILGMLEKAVFYSEYQSIRYSGYYDEKSVIFAELLSALKRSLALILVLIVSLGYGIVRPRLGTTVPRLVAVGLLYLIFSSIEGVLRVTGGFSGTVAIVANLSLSLIDSCVMLWVFISLSRTIRLLKLRKNVVKLSLYQHFTNTLIFSVLASIIFIIWTTKQFMFVECQSAWRELWVDDAFWRLLFSTILLVIMVLLRPSVNSQRFSHSPLIDEEDDEGEAKEPMLNEAFEGMKIRKSETHANQKLLSKESSKDEENIPTTVVDIPLPVVLDEEEELNAKMERSKMI